MPAFRHVIFLVLFLCGLTLAQAPNYNLPPDAQKIVDKARDGKALTPKEMAQLKAAMEKLAAQAAKGVPTPKPPAGKPGRKADDDDPGIKCSIRVGYTLRREEPREGSDCKNEKTVTWTQITESRGTMVAKGRLSRFHPGGGMGEEMIQIALDGPAQAYGGTTITGGDEGGKKGDKARTNWNVGKMQGFLVFRSFPSRGDRMTGEFNFQPEGTAEAWSKPECEPDEQKGASHSFESIGMVGHFLPSMAKEQFAMMTNPATYEAARAMAKKFGHPVPAMPADMKAQMMGAGPKAFQEWKEKHLGDWSISLKEFKSGFDSNKPFRVTGRSQGSVKIPEGGTVQGNLAITITVGEVPPLEVVVRPQKYESWMPEGGADEKTVGNTLGVEAYLLTDSGGLPPLNIKAKSFKFELSDVSKEPGVCLNQPLQNATRDADLKFEAMKNPGSELPDEKTVITKGPDIVGTAVISCYDWGAFGKLKVTAELEDGQKLTGYLAGQKGTTEILLPKRAKDSKIADAFRKNTQAKDDSDDDEQPGNTNKGDGLTFFEEYRGLMAKGQHLRLKLDRKEVIVENTIGQLIAGGLGLFERTANIDIVGVKPGELSSDPTDHKKDRLVNINSETGKRGDQHGLRITEGPTNPSVPGRAFHYDDPTGAKQTPMKSPAECKEVRLKDQHMFDLRDPSVLPVSRNALQDTMDWVVAHELAHGVGVQHHGKNPGLIDITVGAGLGQEVIDANGQQMTLPAMLQGEVGIPGGDAGGDVDCIMTYNGIYDWIRVPGGGQITYYKIGSVPHGTHFCVSKAGTGRNAGGKLFGNASVGECLKQFQVRDW
jgi:hypothetical protein